MTTIRKLTELFRALATDNLVGARAIATEISVMEETKGHRGAARTLRGALAAPARGPNGRSSTGPDAGQMLQSGGLVRVSSARSLQEVTLSAATRRQLDEVVTEWKERALLLARGVPPRSKLLFHGPPGCGKSLTAQALGRELDLPVYMVRFDAVIGAFLGQTAMHLRQIFHFAEMMPCVLLLDELDALGKRRGNPLDVGELDRIVISLLQELEHSRPMGIVVATTNLARHLDDALWRRFDLDISFRAPTRVALRDFASNVSKRCGIRLSETALERASRATSYSLAERVVLDEFRRAVIAQARSS
jgi:SpoVK/Ycf46/Vps4 family AAA+-type ATPase